MIKMETSKKQSLNNIVEVFQLLDQMLFWLIYFKVFVRKFWQKKHFQQKVGVYIAITTKAKKK